MAYHKIGDWAIGYLEALSTGDSITKPQLEKMISRIQSMINEIESNKICNYSPSVVEESEEF